MTDNLQPPVVPERIWVSREYAANPDNHRQLLIDDIQYALHGDEASTLLRSWLACMSDPRPTDWELLVVNLLVDTRNCLQCVSPATGAGEGEARQTIQCGICARSTFGVAGYPCTKNGCSGTMNAMIVASPVPVAKGEPQRARGSFPLNIIRDAAPTAAPVVGAPQDEARAKRNDYNVIEWHKCLDRSNSTVPYSDETQRRDEIVHAGRVIDLLYKEVQSLRTVRPSTATDSEGARELALRIAEIHPPIVDGHWDGERSKVWLLQIIGLLSRHFPPTEATLPAGVPPILCGDCGIGIEGSHFCFVCFQVLKERLALPAGEALSQSLKETMKLADRATSECRRLQDERDTVNETVERLNAEVARFSTLADERHDLLCAERCVNEDLRFQLKQWESHREHAPADPAAAPGSAQVDVEAERQAAVIVALWRAIKDHDDKLLVSYIKQALLEWSGISENHPTGATLLAEDADGRP